MVGSRIKEQRKKIRYTQKMLADKVSASPQVISNWERGYTEPSADDISRLSEALECSSDYLLGKSNNPNQTSTLKGISENDERDIAKRLKEFEKDLENSDGLAFDGEPMSDEAKESLLESMELLFRQTQRINKKYTPKKYREDE